MNLTAKLIYASLTKARACLRLLSRQPIAKKYGRKIQVLHMTASSFPLLQHLPWAQSELWP